MDSEKAKSSLFGWSEMKKSESELALEELFASQLDDHKNNSTNNHNKIDVNRNGFFPLKNSEASKELRDKALSSPNLNPTTMGSPSSICVDSLRTDEEEEYMEAASYEEFLKNPTDIKRIKRMVSNRESARRSRRRTQVHLSELEKQCEELREENSSLFQQVSDASHQFKDAATNNRLLKSHVGALRAKVKLAEDMVTRGALTSSLTHLLQNYLNTPEDFM